MFIIPYGADLRTLRSPVICWGVFILCVGFFLIQIDSDSFTRYVMYEPESLNPVFMVLSSFAHADLMHISGNLLFFLAFAPSVEIIIADRLKFTWILVLIALVIGLFESLATFVGLLDPLPSLGLSGIVMGCIGLSGYIMPQARIRVFFLYWNVWKVFRIKAKYLAILYIGQDIFYLIYLDDYGGIGFLAHVVGGLTGYFYGRFYLANRKAEIADELAQEIEFNRIKNSMGETFAESYSYAKNMEKVDERKRIKKLDDRFMSELYRLVISDNNSRAICLILERYDLETPVHELEQLFRKMSEWNPSRAQLCVGRMIILSFDEASRYSQALGYIEKCKKISPGFILPVDSRTVFYSTLAANKGEYKLSKAILGLQA